MASPKLPPDHRGPVDVPFRPFDESWRARPIIDLLRQIVLHHPGRIAVEAPGRTISFSMLWRAICRLAGKLAAAPAGPVGVRLPANHLYVAAVYAALAARRTILLLDSGYPPERIPAIGALAGIGFAVTIPGAAVWPGVAMLDASDAFDDTVPVPPSPTETLDADAISPRLKPAWIVPGGRRRPSACSIKKMSCISFNESPPASSK
jgi:acyl-CoA synthetase (AMP-forming)/AMP-acid ligase II